mmetsp:Transcript_73971/g.158530  ORF Transcript_73971/g.158530 Transcript_73971/m.158530 type:complete len:198 (+) Transcript_73971:80-673(+)
MMSIFRGCFCGPCGQRPAISYDPMEEVEAGSEEAYASARASEGLDAPAPSSGGSAALVRISTDPAEVRVFECGGGHGSECGEVGGTAEDDSSQPEAQAAVSTGGDRRVSFVPEDTPKTETFVRAKGRKDTPFVSKAQMIAALALEESGEEQEGAGAAAEAAAPPRLGLTGRSGRRKGTGFVTKGMLSSVLSMYGETQ